MLANVSLDIVRRETLSDTTDTDSDGSMSPNDVPELPESCTCLDTFGIENI